MVGLPIVMVLLTWPRHVFTNSVIELCVRLVFVVGVLHHGRVANLYGFVEWPRHVFTNSVIELCVRLVFVVGILHHGRVANRYDFVDVAEAHFH